MDRVLPGLSFPATAAASITVPGTYGADGWGRFHGDAGTPDFAAWGMEGVTAQFGMQSPGQDYVQKNVCIPLHSHRRRATGLIVMAAQWLHTLLYIKTPLQRIQPLHRTKN